MDAIGSLPEQGVGYLCLLPPTMNTSFSDRVIRRRRRGRCFLSRLSVFAFVLLSFGSLQCAVTDNGSNFIIPEGETYMKFGAWTYSNSVEVYGRLVAMPYDGTPPTGTLKLVAPTITVHPGGVIDADYAGYRAGEGPGIGVSPAGTAGSGAGYGNPGGKGYGLGARGGLPYGYASGEVYMGSGGLSTDTATGGRGGGAIHLRGTESITISGTVTASGQDGESDPTGFAAGGGSGGGILIDGSGANVVIDGLVSSKGGNGGDGKYGGGGGSAGRIRVLTGPAASLSSGSLTAKGGLAGASQEMDYPPEPGIWTPIWHPTRQATYTPPSVDIVAPESPQSAAARIPYILTDAEYDICSITVEYSLDGGNSFKPATLAPIWYQRLGDRSVPVYGATDARGSPSGLEHYVLWDSLKDIGVARIENVRIRMTPNDGFGQPRVSDTSSPFAVDNGSVAPGAPILEHQGPEFIGITIDRGGIYPPAEFAIFNAKLGKYVDAQGMSVSPDPVWRGEFEWGFVEIRGLTPDTAHSFQVKARDLQIGLETDLGPPLSVSTTPLGAFARSEFGGVVHRLVIDKSEYQFAESVNIQYIIENNSSETYSLTFGSSCQFTFEVYQGDEPIYRPWYACLAVITGLTVEPGKAFVYSETWHQMKCVDDCPARESVWPGHYTLVGYLGGYGGGYRLPGPSPSVQPPSYGPRDYREPYPTTGLSVEFDIIGDPQKRIAGRLPGDVTLTKAGSPYQVTYDLFVPEGVTLTVQPGVELRFDYRRGYYHPAAGLSVQGTLLARGTPEDKIVFRSARSSPTSCDWKGIVIQKPAKDPRYDSELGRYVDGCILEHCVIEHALTPLRMVSASPVISNCIIRNNGESEEGFYPLLLGQSSGAVFISNTIVSNFGFITGDFHFINSIIWHNKNLGLEYFTARYCNIEGGYPGTDNINADPLFVDVAGGDYHLLPGSPCIDAGATDVEGIPELDMDGEPRISGTAVDMGADEYADTDADGLLDRLEVLYFQSLSFGPHDDPDDDGLTTAQELESGTNPAKGDTDGDGVSDGKESAAGTNPLDSDSCLKIMALEQGDFHTKLWWKSEPGRRYRVHVSQHMMAWSCVRDGFTASGPTSMFIESYDEPVRRRFYKIELLP